MTESTASAATSRHPGRAASIALWVLQVLIAAVFVFASIPKITLDPMATEGFAVLGIGSTGTLLIGLCELAAAVAMFVPRLTGLAAACSVVLMVGAVLVSLAFYGPAMAVLPGVVLVMVAIVAWARRAGIVALLRSVTGLARVR